MYVECRVSLPRFSPCNSHCTLLIFLLRQCGFAVLYRGAISSGMVWAGCGDGLMDISAAIGCGFTYDFCRWLAIGAFTKSLVDLQRDFTKHVLPIPKLILYQVMTSYTSTCKICMPDRRRSVHHHDGGSARWRWLIPLSSSQESDKLPLPHSLETLLMMPQILVGVF